MAADPNPALRKELMDAVDALDLQIRGLDALMASASISTALSDAVGGPLGLMKRRRELLMAVEYSLDAVLRALVDLEADGYPGLIAATLSPDAKKEMDAYVAAAQKKVVEGAAAAMAAADIFKVPGPRASQK